MSAKIGRTSVLTETLILEFCNKLRVTGSIETAIKLTGIGRETYYGWVRKVREGEGSVMQRRFFAAVEKTEGTAKMFREMEMAGHYKKSWQAIAWWLERKYSHEYGQRRPMALPDPDAQAEDGIINRIIWDVPVPPDSKKKKKLPIPEQKLLGEAPPEPEDNGLEILDTE